MNSARIFIVLRVHAIALMSVIALTEKYIEERINSVS